MPAKETHIATLQQDARSSCYFCCDVHGDADPRNAFREFTFCKRFTKKRFSTRCSPPSGLGWACRLSLPADGLRIREDRSLEMAGNRLSYGPAALALSAGQ